MDGGFIASQICTEMKWLIDMYIVDYWIDEIWKDIPSSWKSLANLNDFEWSQVMNENSVLCSLREPLPLNILCLRSILKYYSLINEDDSTIATALLTTTENIQRYSSIIKYEKRGVKEKKRGEIDKIIPIILSMIDYRPFSVFIDIGCGIGHLSRAISCSIPNLHVSGVEANSILVKRARDLDEKRNEENIKRIEDWVMPHSTHLFGNNTHGGVCVGGLHSCGDLTSSILRLTVSQSTVSSCLIFGCCYHKLNGGLDKKFRQTWEEVNMEKNEDDSMKGFPLSKLFNNVDLSYAARELACHSKQAYIKQMESTNNRSHLHHSLRAMTEWLIVKVGGGRHIGIRGVTIHNILSIQDFIDYLDKAMIDHQELLLKIKDELSLSSSLCEWIIQSILSSTSLITTLYCLRVMIAPLVEDVILCDRVAFLRENGMESSVHRLFNPSLSPRCFAIIGVRS